MRRKVLLRFSAVLSLAALVLASAWPALAYPPAKPYDPRPLMAEVEKRVTTDQYTFLVMGDAQGSPAFPGLVARAEALKPDFVILTGDMVQEANPGNYDLLERQFGGFMRKVPTWPCMGNHDSRQLGARAFPPFYGVASPRYSFDFRNARFICLEVTYSFGLGPEVTKWLEEQLAEGRKAGKHIFVYHHRPPYTVGGRPPGGRDPIHNKPNSLTGLLSKYGVVADFAGHEHIYYRTKRDGVNYIIQGLAGGGVYGLGRTGEAIEGDAYYGATGDGQCKLHTAAGDKVMKRVAAFNAITVNGSKVTGKIITADGEIIDEYVLSDGK